MFLETGQYFGTSQNGIEDKQSKTEGVLFNGLSLLGILIFFVQNASTPLCLSRDKTKGQSSKNITTLTLTKTLFKKYGHSPVDFQIILST